MPHRVLNNKTRPSRTKPSFYDFLEPSQLAPGSGWIWLQIEAACHPHYRFAQNIKIEETIYLFFQNHYIISLSM
jgi:hypothetical protein